MLAGRVMDARLLLHLLLLAVLTLPACTTVGNKKVDDVNSYLELREGQSSKHDVFATFGQPHDVRYSQSEPAQCLWVYYKMHTRLSAWTFVPFVGLAAGGDAREATRAYFTFDAGDQLTRIQTVKKEDYENMWAGAVRAVSRASDKTQAQRVEEEMKKVGKPFDKKVADSVAALRDE